ncbi:hypothetical protein KA977_12315, partial [Candidatus Dependentiae bacterium]|nr:hypothetical protein [Candidatus Dependentiae bacterium]
KSLNYPIPPAKTEIPDEFISAIKNISSLNSEFLNEIPDKIRDLYSFEILKNKYLNFINNIIS